jgi:hypothetical protein
LPRLSWLGVILAAALIGHALGGMRMALIGGLGFLYIAVFRQWDSAMLTLALIVVCVPLCVALGMVVGIWGHASPRADRLVITPALDLMQTIPTFAYLIPMLLLFGISPVSACSPPPLRNPADGPGHHARPAQGQARESAISPTWRVHARTEAVARCSFPRPSPR